MSPFLELVGVVENAKKVLDRLRGIGGVEERPVRVYGFNRESSK